MKKLIFSLIVIAIFCLKGQSASFTTYSFNPIKDGKKMEITIGANRASGEMQLRFTTGKPGKAAITVFNESGAIILQQTDEVTNSINTIPLKNATQLPEGAYKVRLTLNNETYITRFMIWK